MFMLKPYNVAVCMIITKRKFRPFENLLIREIFHHLQSFGLQEDFRGNFLRKTVCLMCELEHMLNHDA